jgi:hypothetical protein
VTAFYDRRGELLHFSYVPFLEQDDLREAVERCALRRPPDCESG